MNRRIVRNSILILSFGPLASFAYSLHVVTRQQELDRSLVQAIRFGNQDKAIGLIEAGADPNTWDPTAQEPLIKQLLDLILHRYAVDSGDFWAVDTLLKHGAHTDVGLSTVVPL